MTDRATPGRFHYADPQLDRVAAKRAGDREVERLAMLATQPSPLPEEQPMTDTPTDPDAPAPTSMPIAEWMKHESARQVRREKATREAKFPRDGEIDIDARTRAAHRTSGF